MAMTRYKREGRGETLQTTVTGRAAKGGATFYIRVTGGWFPSEGGIWKQVIRGERGKASLKFRLSTFASGDKYETGNVTRNYKILSVP